MHSVFAFNASAVAFGGVINAPKRRVLSSVGSTVLSPTGGEGTAVETNYSEGGVSFDRAVTSVYGYSPDDVSYTTRTHVEIDGLVMFDRLEIGLLSATLTSKRTLGQKESQFTVVASIDGVRVDGTAIDTSADCAFFEDKATHADFMKFVGKETQKRLDERFAWEGRRPVPKNELVRCSLLQPSGQTGQISPTVFRTAHTLKVADFGTIHLGEVLIKPSLRRVNLVRLELRRRGRTPGIAPLALRPMNATGTLAATAADEERGSFTAGSGEGNGTQIFP